MLLHAGRAPAPHDLWRSWTFAPFVVAGLLASGAVYGRGARALWARAGAGRGLPPWRARAFYAALSTLAIALLSPLDAAAAALFSAHMMQHLLLVMVAAPLLVLGDPGTMLWAASPSNRRAIGRVWRRASTIRLVWDRVTRPAAAISLHVFALWVWHAPVLYESAVRHESLHALEHATFLATALLFWWPLLRPHGRRMRAPAAVAYLFAATLQCTLLGAIIALARHPWYSVHLATTGPWGLSPLEDQQLAGLIMWVPAGVVYLLPLVVLLVRALSASSARAAASLQGVVPSGAVSVRGTP